MYELQCVKYRKKEFSRMLNDSFSVGNARSAKNIFFPFDVSLICLILELKMPKIVVKLKENLEYRFQIVRS